jgi:uncharacterized protein (TIGR02117 family)
VRRLLVGLLAGWLAGCTSLPALPAGDAALYVVARGWHTDIGLRVDATSASLAPWLQDFPGAHFVVFGFGERNFYMAHETDSFTMLAALLPSASAILLTALNAPPPVAFVEHEVVTLHVPAATVARIAGLIRQSLESQSDGAPVPLGNGPYAGSRFYASNETYDAFYTCNTWTARVLRDAGIPVRPDGVVFVSQLMRQVEWLAAAQAR